MASTDESNLAAVQAAETAGTTTNGAGGTGATGVVSREVGTKQTMKDLLTKRDGGERKCSNPIWIMFFWIHLTGMIAFIVYVMTSDSSNIGGIFESILNFFTGDSIGRKFTICMATAAVLGGLFSFIWVIILNCFQDKSIKVSLVIYHLAVAGLIVWAIVDDVEFVMYFYLVQLVITDIILFLQRDQFQFSEAMCKIGVNCVMANTKMQFFAYSFMPFQIALAICWWLGFVYAFVWEPDLWWFWVCLFAFSYNWVAYFFHFIVHTFVSVLGAYWIMNLSDGYGKASQSCKMAFTTSQGPISIASLIMAILALIRSMIRCVFKIFTCYTCYGCIYAALCGWIEAIIARFNEYVLAEVALLNIEFSQGSMRLVGLFEHTGLKIITNEVAWGVPLTVGYMIGFCFSGGITLGIHQLVFESEGDVGDILQHKELQLFFFVVYGWLGGYACTIGLVPLRSSLSSTFVVWAEEPLSFAQGQPELYLNLMGAVDGCEKVKSNLNIPDQRANIGQEKTI